MERRAFVQLLAAGIGTMSVATPAKALNLFMPVGAHAHDPALPLEPSVATPEDMDRVQIEKAWYGHWRRVNRRHYRRVSRRVYRRHYYY